MWHGSSQGWVSDAESSITFRLLALVAVVIGVCLVLRCAIVGGTLPATFTSTKKRIKLVLLEREKLSHDTVRIRFALPSQRHVLGLPPGMHIALSAALEDGEREVSRPYTPISSDADRGFVDFVIKVYFPNPPRFPFGGRMSQHLHALPLGRSIYASGPRGRVQYVGGGVFRVELTRGERSRGIPEKRIARRVGLIAGGSGLTPCLQVIHALLREKSTTVRDVRLLYANKTEADILLRDTLDGLAARQSRFRIAYTLDEPPSSTWTGETGFVTADMIASHIPPPGQDTLVLLCGPPPMIDYACIPNLQKLGHAEQAYIMF